MFIYISFSLTVLKGLYRATRISTFDLVIINQIIQFTCDNSNTNTISYYWYYNIIDNIIIIVNISITITTDVIRVGPESTASKKRRAMAGCRTNEYRNQVPGGITELNCNIKVNKGNSQFMLDILDSPAAASKWWMTNKW